MPARRASDGLPAPPAPLWLGVLLGLVPGLSPLDNGLLRTPPMGWEPWLRFKCNTDCAKDPENCISERLIRAMADRLAADGWKERGYEYVTLDDCWAAGKRDARGRLQADPTRFPSGMKALADYVHSKGLKFGIYSDLGNATCAGYPGTTLDTVEMDANTFAEWGVDMLKLDGCFSNSSLKAIGYPKMSRALNQTGRPIAFSCSWPAYEGGLPPKVNYTLLGQICNFWRNYGDIEDSWDSLFHIIEWYGDHQDILQPASGPGRWNDPDMDPKVAFFDFPPRRVGSGRLASCLPPADCQRLWPEPRAVQGAGGAVGDLGRPLLRLMQPAEHFGGGQGRSAEPAADLRQPGSEGRSRPTHSPEAEL